MKNIQIKSVLEQIATEVFQITDVNKAKQIIVAFLKVKKIKEDDKMLIINNTSNMKNINEVHRYLCNSLLAYEGLRVK